MLLSLQLVWENSSLFVSYSVVCGSTLFSVASHVCSTITLDQIININLRKCILGLFMCNRVVVVQAQWNLTEL